MNEEIAFPRGRVDHLGSNVNKEEMGRPSGRKRSNEDLTSTIREDFLFGSKAVDSDTIGTIPSSSSRKKKKKKDHGEENGSSTSFSLLPLGGGYVIQPSTKKKPSSSSKATTTYTTTEPIIEPLSFQKLGSGTKLLGIVRDVQRDYAIISLPNLLSGYVLNNSKNSASNLCNVLSTNQILSVTIVKAVTEPIAGSSSKRKRIEVAVKPSALNKHLSVDKLSADQKVRGQVLSIEDHGCLVDLGLNKKGFLPFDKIEQEYEIDNSASTDDYNEKVNNTKKVSTLKLNCGRILDFIVSDGYTSSASPQIIPLTLPSTKKMTRLNISTSGYTQQITLHSLAPGSLVTARIEHIAKNGLCVTFLGNKFRGSIELVHLGGYWIPNNKDISSSNSANAEWRNIFKNIKTVKARVIAVDPITKIIRLSLLSHLLEMKSPPLDTESTPKIGTVIDNCTVIKLDPNVGALLSLPPSSKIVDDNDQNEENDNVDDDNRLVKNVSLLQSKSFNTASKIRTAYVHISKAMDTSALDDDINSSGKKSKKKGSSEHQQEQRISEAAFSKHFALSTKHKIRILNTSNLFENILSCATAPSIVDAHVLTHNDLKPGQLYKNVPIIKHLTYTSNKSHPSADAGPASGGILVDFGSKIRGLVQPQHLFDTYSSANNNGLTSYREKILKTKYAINSKIDVRVLTVDPLTKRCLVTAKKSLVKNSCFANSKGTNNYNENEDCQAQKIITSYTDLDVGTKAVGFISHIDDYNIYVTFYNNVYGKVTSKSLAAELGIDNHRLNYHVGDVVNCRVIRCICKKKRRRSYSDDNTDHGNDHQIHKGSSHEYWDLVLSLNIGDEIDDEEMGNAAIRNADKANKKVMLQSGAIIPPKSMKIVQLITSKPRKDTNGDSSQGFIPGYAVVSLKSKYVVMNEDCEKDKLSSPKLSLPYVECKLSFDQLVDDYDNEDISSKESMDKFAANLLKVGKKINQQGLILTDPNKSQDDYSSGIGPMPTITLRPGLIKTAESTSSFLSNEQEDNGGKDGNRKKSKSNRALLLPSSKTELYMGAYVNGFVTQIDPRYGAFVRFLDNITGLVPKVQKGLELRLYSTVTCRVTAIDIATQPMKLLLKKARTPKQMKHSDEAKKSEDEVVPNIKPGDVINGSVEVIDVNFIRATVKLLNKKEYGSGKNVRARIHVTMADSSCIVEPTKTKKGKRKKTEESNKHHQAIKKHHPFYRWKIGMELSTKLTCVANDVRKGVAYIELTNRYSNDKGEESHAADEILSPLPSPIFVEKASEMKPGTCVSGIVSHVPKNNRGVWLQICPGISSYIPALELSTNVCVLNNLSEYYPVGGRIHCRVMDKSKWEKKKRWGAHIHRFDDSNDESASKRKGSDVVFLSALMFKQAKTNGDGEDKGNNGNKRLKKTNTETQNLQPALPQTRKPLRGDLIVGRINRSLPMFDAPALMLDLRGGFVGRCCITELEEVDEWINMPLGRLLTTKKSQTADMNAKHENRKNQKEEENDTGEDEKSTDGNVDDPMEIDDEEETVSNERHQIGNYPHGQYVQCRVLSGIPMQPMLEISLRSSRVEGDLEDDEGPEEKEMVQAYVVETNKKGCFVRLSRQVKGRVILKELCDGFLQDPAASYPMGRLVAGKVKSVREIQAAPKKKNKRKDPIKAVVDLDMRESTLLESQDKLQLGDIKIGSKHKGIVTRIDTYGVFVRIDNSDVSGLVHKSECSDNYIKNLADLYDPGDLVKVLVLKIDMEQKRIGFSMKASHFEDDEDSDDDSSMDVSIEGEGSDVELEESERTPTFVSKDEETDNDSEDNSNFDSDDENFAAKLARKMEAAGKAAADDTSDDETSNSSDTDTDTDDDNSDGESDDEEHDQSNTATMDTDVGFDWGFGSSPSTTEGKTNVESDDSSDDEDSDEDDDTDKRGNNHKSRKKAAARRREEQEITRRETALADGTADDNPETIADFERLLASEPNNSEHWIRYMAYHLSLADVQTARNIAQRAFDRIEFRMEGEKLNVWTALLTLELKYGGKESLQNTIDRACQHNNPKQVYLRVCEMLEREVSLGTNQTDDVVIRADNMFSKMCKKFKSKKTVWIAHLRYLLQTNRHQEAHSLLKQALISLREYKHVEVMSKFAQMEFEHGSAERGRTIFDGLLEKYPKRLDLLFVYVDKEVKSGDINTARVLFEKAVDTNNTQKRKLNDKQMKSLFKKWYRIEEVHGTNERCDHVKNAARNYVETTSAV